MYLVISQILLRVNSPNFMCKRNILEAKTRDSEIFILLCIIVNSHRLMSVKVYCTIQLFKVG